MRRRVSQLCRTGYARRASGAWPAGARRGRGSAGGDRCRALLRPGRRPAGHPQGRCRLPAAGSELPRGAPGVHVARQRRALADLPGNSGGAAALPGRGRAAAAGDRRLAGECRYAAAAGGSWRDAGLRDLYVRLDRPAKRSGGQPGGARRALPGGSTHLRRRPWRLPIAVRLDQFRCRCRTTLRTPAGRSPGPARRRRTVERATSGG